MESAPVPQTNDPKPDEQPADGELTRAYERIKSAEEDLARLDRLVSGLERGSDTPPTRPAKAGAERSGAPPDTAPAPESKVRQQGLKGDRSMLRVFVGLLLAIGILGAAFASQYRDEAKAIMARWAPPISSPPPEVSEVRSPASPPTVQLAAAEEQTPLPAPPVHKEAESVTSPDQTSELAQSLKTITRELASINEKLEQLKSRNEQTLREHADAIQQLKTAQETGAGDNARLAAQVQALQTQLTALSAKSAGRSVTKENDTAARQHIPAAAPRRPRPPRWPWMPPPYMVDPYGGPDW
jgi:hypothetical protein